MTSYKTPQADIKFLMDEVLDFPAHYQSIPAGAEATPDMVDAIISECAKFAENVLAPINQSGDEEGCQLLDGEVITPKGFKEAYQQWVEGGWQGLSHPVEYGGQGLPLSLGMVKAEIVGTSNWSWGMYPGLSLGAMNTIYVHADEEQKQTYLTPLTEGRWAGTMCLTEPHCGSDLAQVKTKAEPNEDGSYKVTGTKIFISSGDHDLAENIVHVVLARIPGEGDGIRGISLFIIPKFLPNNNGGVGERNQVSVGSIEKKMGIHGSSTCVMNFDGAKGFLLGEQGKGVAAMFTFMNTARIGTAIQGIGAAELSFQNSLPYALDRRSMFSLSGKKEPDYPNDRIIHHPDVRRLLLKQKAIAEGGRAMLYDASKYADRMVFGSEAEAEAADEKLGFLTPVLKAFFTEMGFEVANDGMQVFGGHGFIREWGMEQIVRDTRIATLYEGTTGIQSLDLLGRKVVLDKFKEYKDFNVRILKFIKETMLSSNPHKMKMLKFICPLISYQMRWQACLARIVLRARKNPDAIGAASYDFLMFTGFFMTAYYWAMMAQTAYEKLNGGGSQSREFYEAKINTAEFYFQRMLPRAKGHAATMAGSLNSLMAMKEENFNLGG